MEWISVKDRLPEEDEEVLYTDTKNIYLGFLDSERGRVYWTHYDYLEDKNISHWMPLPMPPAVFVEEKP